MIIRTERLRLRKLELSDAAFIITLVNEPGWLEYIGDRNIHSKEDAKNYIINGPFAMYKQYGFGLLLIQDQISNKSLGLCGLLQRDYFDAPDLGFALLASEEGKGYAFEASHAILTQEFHENKRQKIWAFTKLQNLRSQKLLLRLGFKESVDDPKNGVNESLYLNRGLAYR